jgi:hypothetical protein
LSFGQGVSEKDDRGQNSEELSRRRDDRARQGAEVTHAHEDEVLKRMTNIKSCNDCSNMQHQIIKELL